MLKVPMPKMIVTDADGTFVKYSTRCLQSSVDAATILKEKGIVLVLATGRGQTSMSFIDNMDLFDYLIGGNGAFLCDLRKNKILYEKFIPEDEAKKLVKIAIDNNLCWSTESHERVYFSKTIDPKQNFYQRAIQSGYHIVLDDNIEGEIPKLVFLPDEKNDLDSLFNMVLKNYDSKKYKIYRSFQTCELVQKDLTKWSGVEFLSKHLGIHKKDIWAIGDSSNDIEMIQNAGFSIAMGNALPSLKEVADYIADDVSNDGWSKAFLDLGVINA